MVVQRLLYGLITTPRQPNELTCFRYIYLRLRSHHVILMPCNLDADRRANSGSDVAKVRGNSHAHVVVQSIGT